MTWDERTVRGSPARLRNLRVLHEEVGLLLEELTGMGEEDRLAAHDHQGQLARVLERMRDEVGRLGADPAPEGRTITGWKPKVETKSTTTNGGRP